MSSNRRPATSGPKGVIRIGREGNDTIMGGPGRDALYGGPGDDVFTGSPAPDLIYGDAGTDVIDYSTLSAAVSVNLATSTVSGGDATDDRLVGIEQVIATDHDDSMTGDDADNRLEGRGGNDTLDGGAGNDTLIGGSGADSIRFGRASGRDTVILDGSADAVDVIDLGAGIAFDQLWYDRTGTDLAVSVLGTDATVVLKDFFGTPARRNVALRTAAGETLDAAGLTALEAMLAGQTRPDQDRLPTALQDRLDPVLRSVWASVQSHLSMTEETLANADYTLHPQNDPTIAVLSGGGYVVAWRDQAGQDGSSHGVFAQRLDNSGARVGKQFQVNTSTGLAQYQPAATGLSDGGYVITWTSNGSDGSGSGVSGQRFSADGSKVGAEFQVNTYTSGNQVQPAITTLADGGFLVAWTTESGQDGSSAGVFAQRFAADGTKAGSEFQVNTHTSNTQYRPAVADLADGGFAIVWASNGQDGSGYGIFGQRYAADGTKIGSEFQVNTYTSSHQQMPAVTGLAGGGFVVLWESTGQDGSSGGVYGQMVDKDGQAVGTEFRVNSYTRSNQMNPAVTALDDGGFMAAWDSEGQDGSSRGVFGQRFAADGARVGSEFQINDHTRDVQFQPAIAGLRHGRVAVAMAWTSGGRSTDHDIATRVLKSPVTRRVEIGDADNNRMPVSGPPGSKPVPQIGTNGDDTLTGGAGQGGLNGKAGNDRLTGGGTRDYLRGGAGHDTVSGGAGNDLLHGDHGNDDLSGGAGQDLLIGGRGDDTLSGGSDADRYVFSRGHGADRIDNTDTARTRDILEFKSGIQHDQLWFARSGRDLVVSVTGTADAVTVADWYAGADNRHLTILADGGKATLVDSQVQSLVTAMAGYAPPALGTLTLPSSGYGTVETAIAASWQLGA